MPASFDPPLPTCVNQPIGSLNLLEIQGTDCIGDTRVAINNNVRYLGTAICNLSGQRLMPIQSNTTTPVVNLGSREFQLEVRDGSITDAKLAAGAVTANAIASNAVAADKINLVTNLNPNGYQIMPGGLIMQWGQSAAFTTEGSQEVLFPVVFPTACLQVIAGQLYPTDDILTNAFVQTVSWNVSSVRMRAQSDPSQPTVAKPLYGSYIAIGH